MPANGSSVSSRWTGGRNRPPGNWVCRCEPDGVVCNDDPPELVPAENWTVQSFYAAETWTMEVWDGGQCRGARLRRRRCPASRARHGSAVRPTADSWSTSCESRLGRQPASRADRDSADSSRPRASGSPADAGSLRTRSSSGRWAITSSWRRFAHWRGQRTRSAIGPCQGSAESTVYRGGLARPNSG